MKRLQLPLIAGIALPSDVNFETSYLINSTNTGQKINKGFLLIELVLDIAVLAIFQQ